MAKSIVLTGEGRASQWAEIIKKSFSGEIVSSIDRSFGDAELSQLILERLFMRNSSYASLTALFVSENGKVTVDLVTSGEGSGVFNISWGAGKSYIKDVEKCLTSMGMKRQE